MEYHVMQYYKSMRDFVTSRWAEIVFSTREKAEEYISNFESNHPGRCSHYIKEIDPLTKS